MFTGIDIVEIKKVKRLLEQKRSVELVFTTNELKEVQDVSSVKRVQTLAGKFALKEAVSKTLGTGFDQGVSPIDIEVLKGDYGRPTIKLYNQAKVHSERLRIQNISVSLSHSEEYAVGLAIAEINING